ncbi:MAG: transketolase [Ignavibacteriaceae bacterium]|nr:transketolase [Ignavibacteriaceae bacterium]
MPDSKNIDQLSINTIRFLAVDAVQKANSGHPGMPMGCAPIGYTLFTKYMNHNPENPNWVNRDRFILSAGHGSMLLYSLLHLTGYNLPMEQLKLFRQWDSLTPGHPEHHLTPGVETTTGPLGQGFANAIGIAIAEAHVAANFNKEDFKIIDHFIYGICSDGDLMEGVSHEAASIAGHLGLGKLIFFYDNNSITIDGKTSLAFSEKVGKRFESYNWHVQYIEDVNDLEAIKKTIRKAQKVTDKPSLIVTKTHIGFGSPNKQDTSEAHGSPLGDEETKLTKKNLGWPEDKFFYVPEEVDKHFKSVIKKGKKAEHKWNNLFNSYKTKYPEDAILFEKYMNGDFGDEWISHLPIFEDDGKKIATRSAGGKIINAIAKYLPNLIGGSADLNPSTNTYIKESGAINTGNFKGRNIHFGIREHGMTSILNGMALYGGIIPFGSTFLVFSDYLRPAIRLASLSQIKPILVFTHDSIGLGEDGPTHQPIEHLASLRAIPNVIVIRPADANETSYAWQAAIQHKNSPVILVLTRQGLPVIDQNKYPSASNLLKGAYILKEAEKGIPDIILMATGSEVSVTLKASEELEKEGIQVRVVSFPSWELFEKQTESYKETVLPKNIKARVSIEAGIKQGWEKYIGDQGGSVSIETFGHSAPLNIIMDKYGFGSANIISIAKTVLENINKNKQK